MDVDEQNCQKVVQPFPKWKRILDLCFIVATLPLSVALCAVIAAYIKLASPGPVLFRQERVGLRGQRFMCLKFRTMHVGADHSGHRNDLGQLINSQSPMIKLDACGDSRIIAGCGLLRALGLDELPQLFNVLKGEMSVVGPRPCIPYEFEQFTPAQRRRFDSRPGLTGLWQVSGKNRTTFQQMISLDIRYSQQQSLGLDLFIIAKTPIVLFEQLIGKLFRPKRLPKVVLERNLPALEQNLEKATR